jgi:hypothetical protein
MRIQFPPLQSWNEWNRTFREGATPFDRPLILLIDGSDRLPAALIDQPVASFRDLYLTRETPRLHGPHTTR